MLHFEKIELKGDKTLWSIVLLLMLFSIPVVYSASGYEAYRFFEGDTSGFLWKQVLGLIGSMVIIYIAHIIPFKFYFKFSKHFASIAIFLLVLTLIWGTEHNGAKRWLNIFGLIEIQTSDLARVALIMFVARILTLLYLNRIDFKKAMIKISVATVLSVILIFPADTSTAAILLAIIILLLFIGKIAVKYLMSFILLVVGLVAIYSFVAYAFDFPNRLLTGLSRLMDTSGIQVSIAKAAIVKGGFFGEGPGNGVMKYVFSQSHNDFVFAYTVEEYGLWLSSIILLFFVIFFHRGLAIASQSKKPYAIFLTIGLTLSIVFQSFVHMGVAVNLLPVTGQTLPFVSSGLTSLFINSFAVGIILNVSRITSLNVIEEDFEKQ